MGAVTYQRSPHAKQYLRKSPRIDINDFRDLPLVIVCLECVESGRAAVAHPPTAFTKDKLLEVRNTIARGGQAEADKCTACQHTYDAGRDKKGVNGGD